MPPRRTEVRFELCWPHSNLAIPELVLRGEGLDYREIAGILQLNETSMGTLLRRAQEAFRKEYVKRYGQPKLQQL